MLPCAHGPRVTPQPQTSPACLCEEEKGTSMAVSSAAVTRHPRTRPVSPRMVQEDSAQAQSAFSPVPTLAF